MFGHKMRKVASKEKKRKGERERKREREREKKSFLRPFKTPVCPDHIVYICKFCTKVLYAQFDMSSFYK